jgi:hypothetical protein
MKLVDHTVRARLSVLTPRESGGLIAAQHGRVESPFVAPSPSHARLRGRLAADPTSQRHNRSGEQSPRRYGPRLQVLSERSALLAELCQRCDIAGDQTLGLVENSACALAKIPT